MDSNIDEITESIENLVVNKPNIILCGCISIPDTTRKRFIWKGKPNPNPYYDFKKYTVKQLKYIKQQLNTPLHINNLRQRIGSDNKMKQFLSDFEFFFNKIQNS